MKNKPHEIEMGELDFVLKISDSSQLWEERFQLFMSVNGTLIRVRKGLIMKSILRDLKEYCDGKTENE